MINAAGTFKLLLEGETVGGLAVVAAPVTVVAPATVVELLAVVVRAHTPWAILQMLLVLTHAPISPFR